jgi:transcriptional regulator with XRE-family HTH domain
MSRRDPPAWKMLESMIIGLVGAGISRSEIARQSGLTKATILRYESGEIRRPSADSFRRVEHVYRAVKARK